MAPKNCDKHYVHSTHLSNIAGPVVLSAAKNVLFDTASSTFTTDLFSLDCIIIPFMIFHGIEMVCTLTVTADTGITTIRGLVSYKP